MSIKLLPGDVIAQIKSSVVITSLNGVVYGLLQNSFDASASTICVSIDYGRGNCTVEDDGVGIPPADFHEYGGLCKLYCECRCNPRVASRAHQLLQTLRGSHLELNSTVVMAPSWRLLEPSRCSLLHLTTVNIGRTTR